MTDATPPHAKLAALVARCAGLAPLPTAERGVAVVTSASPDGKLIIYANGTNVIVRDLEVRGRAHAPRRARRTRAATLCLP